MDGTSDCECWSVTVNSFTYVSIEVVRSDLCRGNKYDLKRSNVTLFTLCRDTETVFSSLSLC